MAVATEAMAMVITVAAATATQEVALPRRGDEMALCDGKAMAYAADNWRRRTAELLASLAALWANESASLAGLINNGGRRGEWPAMANAPVSPVYPDALGLAGTVVSPNTDAREVDPLGVDTQGQGSAASRGRCTCEYLMSRKESD